MSWIQYLALALLLCAVGFVGIFSVGAPSLLTGVALLVVAPWRHRRGVVASALSGVWAFVVGYVLVAPLGCTSSAGPAPPGSTAVARTSCFNLLGIDYSGGGSYNPPLMPAAFIGLALGILAAVTTFVSLRRTARQGPLAD